MNIFKLQVRKM